MHDVPWSSWDDRRAAVRRWPGHVSINLLCLGADRFEPNETRETASTPPIDLAIPLRAGAASIYPGDTDWYRWTRPVNFGFLIGTSPGSVDYELYRDGELVAAGNTSTALSPSGGLDPIYRSPDTLEHTWELMIISTTASEYSIGT